jgi:hypothetical protein
MTRTFRTSRLAVALGVAALASSALAPAATAIPYEDLRSPDTVDAARAEGDPPRVVPRAAPIAALGGDGAQDLRSPDAVDAARAAADPPNVAPPASSIAASAADEYQDLRAPEGSHGTPVQAATQDLRSPDTRDAATGYGSTTAAQPVADASPASDGFDWTSAAIGAAAGAGLLLILIAAFAGTGRPGRRSIPARGQSTASA